MATSESEDFESADEDLGDGDGKIRRSNSSSHDVKKKRTSADIFNGTDENIKASSHSETVPEVLEGRNKSIHEALDKLNLAVETREETSTKDLVSCHEAEKSGSTFGSGDQPAETVDGWEDDLEDLIEDESSKQLDRIMRKEDSSEEKSGTRVDDSGEAIQTEVDSSGGGWGSWGSWGVSSLLSTATESVSTLTSHVSQGLNTVLEAGLGAPSPEELARFDLEREQVTNSAETDLKPEGADEETVEDSGGLFGFGRVMSGMSSITKLVETAGSKVVTGGLDTLETIGKKTMDILQEGDPGLKKKRAYFSNKILLSQILREAKEKAELEHKEHVDREAARKAHFETLFDDYQGLVHLEALEMLSKQCELKLQSLLLASTGPALVELQQTLSNLKEECQLPEEEDIEEPLAAFQRDKLANVGKGLGVHVATDKLSKTWDEAEKWLETCRASFESPSEDTNIPTAREVHQNAMAAMARLTAEAVEQFHKAAELLLVLEERNPSKEAKILLDMTSVLCSLVSTAATRFSECLNTSPENVADHETVTSLITNIFLEAAHSSSYIQEAFQLLVPVLQVGLTVS